MRARLLAAKLTRTIRNDVGPRVAALAAALLLLAAAVASAALGESTTSTACTTVGQSTTASCDTEVTPQAKSSDRWVYVGGAKPGESTLPSSSQTPATVNFHTVAFENDDHGFAAGDACQNPHTSLSEVDSCQRVPVIWEYTVGDEGPQWREVYRGSTEGYVGGLAFMSDGRALAVGGTGTYPDREADPSTAENDVAGDARVWTYDSTWTEEADPGRTLGDAPKMHGLAALDCSPRLSDGESCVAGGFRQLWMWHNGRFNQYFTPDSQSAGAPAVDDGASWLFRVRQIRYFPGTTVPSSAPSVIAVTSGCCDPSPANDKPRILAYDDGRWFSRIAAYDTDYGTAHDALPPQTIPDSYYSLGISARPNTAPELSVVATPGGEETHYGADGVSTEQPSRVFAAPIPDFADASPVPIPLDPVSPTIGAVENGQDGSSSSDYTGNLTGEARNPTVSDLRLLAGDGDFAGPTAPEANQLAGTTSGGPDGVIDWAVGELRSTGQGVAYTTTDRGTLTPDAANCPSGTSVTNPSLNCHANTPDQLTAQTHSRSLIALDTYSLDAFRYTPDGSVGWAVGEKGAIERIGGEGSGSTGDQPAPPQLGTRQPATIPNTQPYNVFRPVGPAPQPGTVPALASQPLQQLSPPRLVSAGAANPSVPNDLPSEGVSSIAMSRDGSEGWAVGPASGGNSVTMTLYHYHESRWTRCDPTGAPDALQADPACASLADVASFRDQGGNPVQLHSIVRVPLENGPDASKADDFEAVAVGTTYKNANVVLRYVDGRWSVEDGWMKQLAATTGVPGDVAFTAPDDGWLVINPGTPKLFHFDGSKWIDCSGDHPGCDDRSFKLPLDVGDAIPRLAVAGNRIYVSGTRVGGSVAGQFLAGPSGSSYPVVLYRDRGSCDAPTDSGCWHADGGGYDPGADTTGQTPANQGTITALSVVHNGDGSYSGWAAGTFGSSGAGGSTAPLLQLSGGNWTPWTKGDASADYLAGGGQATTTLLTALPGSDGHSTALAIPVWIPSAGNNRPLHPMVRFSSASERWVQQPTPFSLSPRGGASADMVEGEVQAMASDGQGGAWLAVKQVVTPEPDDYGRDRRASVYFYHYTARAPKPVFQEVEQPIREVMTNMAAGADGSVWVTTESDSLYRYDRLTGWDRIGIPGWDPGRVVTRHSEANAIAVGPDGQGVIVGRGGRIADVGPGRAILDRVAGTTPGHCPNADACGTSRDLRAAAVAGNGSAMVGGDDRALLWRASGGSFHPVTTPRVPSNATFTGVAFSDPQHAWLTTDLGQVFAGTLGGNNDWSWRLEDVGDSGRILTRDYTGKAQPLRAISLNGSGAGYAVGDRGVILQRDPSAAGHPWRRINTGLLDDLDSVALPPGGGPGALIGGDVGVVLTLVNGRWEIARPSDYYDPDTIGQGNAQSAKIVGVAILPGEKAGQVEAWAASQVPSADTLRSPDPGVMLHYTSDPSDPLLDGGMTRAKPLLDTLKPQPDELAFAAFGKSDCELAGSTCPEPQGSNLTNDVITQRIVDAIADRAHHTPGATVAVFTGDVDRASGSDKGPGPLDGAASANPGAGVDGPLDPSIVHKRWTELVADRLQSADVPIFGAIGGHDLSQAQTCAGGNCVSSRNTTGAGLSLPWRQAFADMPAPWGKQGNPAPADEGSWSFKPVPDSSGVESPDGGGAHTHYAVDIERGGTKVLRLVVVDTALKTLTGPGSIGNPVEEQTKWLDDVLSSRPAGERSVVVSETPSYSPSTGATTDTTTDQAAFETAMFTNKVTAVISGRLGWNSLYYACAPGALHDPQPGGAYPAPDHTPCSDTTGTVSNPTSQAPAPAQQAAQALQGLLPDAVRPLVASPQTGLTPIPFAIAASAGGRYGPDGNSTGTASQGFWHGYSLVRIEHDGAVIVDQRPIFDWVGIRAQEHTLSPGQHMTLKGFGREPLGSDQPAQYDDINGPAVTHRYDLVEADPEHPYMPKVDPSAPNPGGTNPNHYVFLDPSVAQIDRQTGLITTGRGSHPRVYAIGLLSVGDKVASWPLVFEPRKNFVGQGPIVLPPVTLPPLHVAAATATSPPAGAPPPPPQVSTIGPPQLPPLPNLPPISNAAAPSPPPPPPAPPPPSFGQPLPLSLSPQPSPISVLGTVVPPSPPPVNPAPPSGGAAKKEARQRQAAVAKSEEGSGQNEGAPEQSSETGGRHDSVQTPNLSMTRHGPDGRPLAFSERARHEQPSAWARDALEGGGLVFMALVLSLGWTVLRPTPRRRRPEVPAPAWVRDDRRRR